jgi:uncharacterized protein YkwD
MRSLVRFALTLAVTAAALLAPRPSHAQLLQNELLWKINDIRVANGVAPLQPVDLMTTAATYLTGEMFQRGYAGHYDSAGRDGGQRLTLLGYNFTSWGEIVGEANADGDASYLWGNDEMLDWWMNSPPHRANILNPSFTEFGLGVSTGARDEGGQTVYHRYWCVIFGSR